MEKYSRVCCKEIGNVLNSIDWKRVLNECDGERGYSVL